MAGGFNVDNRFFGAVNSGVDVIVTGLLWVLTSGIWVPATIYSLAVMAGADSPLVMALPALVFTVPMGAATAALYATLIRSIKYHRGYPTREFFRLFKENFRQATPLYGIWFAFMAFLAADIYITRQWLLDGSKLGLMFYTSIIFLAVGLCWFWFLFPYISRFNCTKKEAVKFTAVVLFANLQWSLLLLAVFAAAVFICAKVQGLLILLPGAYGYLQTIICERVFKKYRTKEDIQKELENNRAFSEGK